MDRTGESNTSHSGLLSGDSGTELGRAVLEASRSRDLRGLDLWRRVKARYDELAARQRSGSAKSQSRRAE